MGEASLTLFEPTKGSGGSHKYSFVMRLRPHPRPTLQAFIYFVCACSLVRAPTDRTKFCFNQQTNPSRGCVTPGFPFSAVFLLSLTFDFDVWWGRFMSGGDAGAQRLRACHHSRLRSRHWVLDMQRHAIKGAIRGAGTR